MIDAVIDTLDTPDGPFTVLANTAGAVLASGWTAEPEVVVARLHPRHRPARIAERATDAAASVRAYYDGDVAAIDRVAVAQFGTPLQQCGWDALRRIRPGSPLTYTAFAAALGQPSAVRAAASICARNAPALFVPCHRVQRSDGSLGGFAWGLAVKQSLLSRESAAAGNDAASAAVLLSADPRG